MRAIYKRKRLFIAEQCRRLFGDRVELLGDEAGMHVQLHFKQHAYGPMDWHNIEGLGVRLSSFEDYAVLKAAPPARWYSDTGI